MLLREIPESDRPRERLLAGGVSVLSDRELLAILIGTSGVCGSGAHELADRLIAMFGGLTALARAAPVDLLRLPGIGPAKAATLTAAFELAHRSDAHAARPVLSSSAAVAAAARLSLATRSRERVIVLCCDTKLRLIGTDVVSDGSISSCPLPIRETLAAVLRRDGSAYAVAHNHPSGDPTPSQDDLRATEQLLIAGEQVGLRFLDHVIVAGRTWRSVTLAR